MRTFELNHARTVIKGVAAVNLAVGTASVVYPTMGGGIAAVFYALSSVVMLEFALFYFAARAKADTRPFYRWVIVLLLGASLSIQLGKIKTDATGIEFVVNLLMSCIPLLGLAALLYEELTTKHVEIEMVADVPPPAVRVKKITRATKTQELPPPPVQDAGVLAYTWENVYAQIKSGMTRADVAKYHSENNGVSKKTAYSRATQVENKIKNG